MAGNWTADTVNALRDEWATGLSTSKIATKLNKMFPGLGATKNSIIGKAHRLHLPARPNATHKVTLSDADQDGIVRAMQSGITNNHLSKVHKIGAKRLIEIREAIPGGAPASYSRKRRSLAVHKGGKPPHPPMAPAIHQAVLIRLMNGMGAENAASRVPGATKGQAHKLLKELRAAGTVRAPRDTRKREPIGRSDAEGMPVPLERMMRELALLAAVQPVVKVEWAPERPSTVFYLPVAGQCCWLDGEHPREYRQCEAMAALRDGERALPKPHSYCMEHRARAYVSRQQRDEVAA